MRATAAVLALTVALLVTGCSRGAGPGGASSAATSAGPTTTMVTFGGSATEGDGVRDRLRDAWPYLVYRDALPESAVLVNAALDGATVAAARRLQAPIANDVHPQIAAVWLGADDLGADTPIADFRAGLTRFVAALRAAGTQRVLLADLPRTLGPEVTPYNDAIRAVARATNAELVELAPLAVSFAPTEGLAPQPDEAGQRVVAGAFTRQLQSGP